MSDKIYCNDNITLVYSEETDHSLVMEFNVRLNQNSGDYAVYANNPVHNRKDIESVLLKSVLDTLLLGDQDSGVESITVKPYKLVLSFSRAASVDEIKEMVSKGMRTPSTFVLA